MTRIKWLIVFLVLANVCFAQKKAVTETGEEVILFDNGTWKYAKASDSINTEIKTNPEKFIRSSTASFQLRSTKCEMGFWLDPKKWQFKKGKEGEAQEFQLELKGQDCYAMIISEKVEIPVETLKNVALQNAREAAPDVEIVKQEYRTVNGLKVLCMQMNGTLTGVKFSYFGYYYSNGSGTLQYVAYTSQNLFSKYLKEFEDLLNGLVETKDKN